MKRRFMVLVAVVASACTGSHSAPTGVSPGQSAPYLTRHFRGVVLTEDDQPVPAATVKMLGSPVPATTDGNGVYQLDVSEPALWTGNWGWVTHPLYEDTQKVVPWAAGQADVTQNFRLYRSMTLAAGESAHLAITPDSSVCTNDAPQFYLCRTVHIAVPSSGTLVLDTIADDSANTFLLVLFADFASDVVPKVTHLSTHLDAATTVVILVLRPLNIAVAGGFTLKTALAP